MKGLEQGGHPYPPRMHVCKSLWKLELRGRGVVPHPRSSSKTVSEVLRGAGLEEVRVCEALCEMSVRIPANPSTVSCFWLRSSLVAFSSLDQDVTVAIGPESGWTDEEIEWFEGKGFEIVTLGEEILTVGEAVTATIGIVRDVVGYGLSSNTLSSS